MAMMEAQETDVKEEGHYDDSFDVASYLSFMGRADLEHFTPIRTCLHDFFSAMDGSERRILDYGSGPNIANLISSSTKAKEIVLAEHCKSNREFVKTWLRDKRHYDWSNDFRNVVCKLEGKSETDVLKRQDLVQKLIKAVVYCDITQDVFIEKGFEGPYDVVMCLLCLENVARDLEEYGTYLKRVLSLVGEKGWIVICDFTYDKSAVSYYTLAGKRYKFLYSTDSFIVSQFQNEGFIEISIQHLKESWYLTGGDKLSFVTARRK